MEEEKPVQLTPEQEQIIDDFAFYGSGIISYLISKVAFGLLIITGNHHFECHYCGASNDKNIAFWHPHCALPICVQCSECGTIIFQKWLYQDFHKKQEKFKATIQEKMPELEKNLDAVKGILTSALEEEKEKRRRDLNGH